MRDSNRTARGATKVATCAAAALALFTFKENLLFAAPPAAAPEPPKTAVVVAAVQDLFVRPDETSSVDDQAILGDRVTVLEDAAGFAKVRTAAGEVAWIPERALRRGEAPAPPAPGREGRARDVQLRARLRDAVLHAAEAAPHGAGGGDAWISRTS